MTKSGAFGPFRYFRVKEKQNKKNFLDVFLRNAPDWMGGWEWGSDGGYEEPEVSLIIFGLKVLFFQKFEHGFHLSILGFWLMR